MSTENKNTISRRILVADDDPVIRHLVTSLIEKEYYEAVVVNDGKEAYRILRSDSNFCAAIFDKMMPHLQGLDVIRFMRTEKRLKRIPVLMITSEQDLQLITESFAAGVTLFLPKPFTPQLFLRTLRLLLNNSPVFSEIA
jgi:two-component system response regulator MtrA